MIIQCPYCTTPYEIDPADLGTTGRQYQCINCNAIFQVNPPQIPPDDISLHQTDFYASQGPSDATDTDTQLLDQPPTLNIGTADNQEQTGPETSAGQIQTNHYAQAQSGTSHISALTQDSHSISQGKPIDSFPAPRTEFQPVQEDVTTYPMKDPAPPQIDFTLPKTAPAPTELPSGFVGEPAAAPSVPLIDFSPPTSHLEFSSGTLPPPPAATPSEYNPYDSKFYGAQAPFPKRDSVYTGNLASPQDISIKLVKEKSVDDINKTNLWNVRIGEKIERGLQLIQIKNWIRAGTLRETDEIQEPGSTWMQAIESMELGRFFRLKAKIESEKLAKTAHKIGEEIYCMNHPGDAAEWTCVGCSRLWCDDCVEHRVFGAAKVSMCPKCGDRCVAIEKKEERPPFWHQIPDLFQYPLRKHGPIMIFLGTSLIYLSQLVLSMTLGLGFFITIALMGLAFSYLLRIVYKSSRIGDKGYMPDFPDVTDNFWREMMLPFFQVLIAYILYFIVPIIVAIYFMQKYHMLFVTMVGSKPVILFNRATLVAALFTILGFYLFPMVISIIAIHKTVIPAFNPILIIRLIKRVLAPYTLMIIFNVVITVSLSFIFYLGEFLLAKAGISSFLIFTLRGFASFYLLAVLARLLGLFIRQVEDDLGWKS